MKLLIETVIKNLLLSEIGGKMEEKKFEKVLEPEVHLELKKKVEECKLKNFEEKDNKLYLDGEEYTGEYYFIEERKKSFEEGKFDKILHKVNYEKGEKHGIEKIYREDGSLSLEDEFYEGELRKREFGNQRTINKYWYGTALGFPYLGSRTNKKSLNIEYYVNGEISRVEMSNFFDLEEKIYKIITNRYLDENKNLIIESHILSEFCINEEKWELVSHKMVYYYSNGKIKSADEATAIDREKIEYYEDGTIQKRYFYENSGNEVDIEIDFYNEAGELIERKKEKNKKDSEIRKIFYEELFKEINKNKSYEKPGFLELGFFGKNIF